MSKTDALPWFEKAESDRLNIRNNLSADRVPWDTVCYHAQQVAEKALKGFLVAKTRAEKVLTAVRRTIDMAE